MDNYYGFYNTPSATKKASEQKLSGGLSLAHQLNYTQRKEFGISQPYMVVRLC